MRVLGFLILLASIPVWAAQLTAGPMLGPVTSRTAAIWMQADAAAEVDVEYWPATRPQERRRSARVRLEAAEDFTATLMLVGLDADTRYHYQLFLDGEPARPEAALTFRTLPLPRPDAAPEISVYLGSCAYVNDPAVDRPGPPSGWGCRCKVIGANWLESARLLGVSAENEVLGGCR